MPVIQRLPEDGYKEGQNVQTGDFSVAIHDLVQLHKISNFLQWVYNFKLESYGGKLGELFHGVLEWREILEFMVESPLILQMRNWIQKYLRKVIQDHMASWWKNQSCKLGL